MAWLQAHFGLQWQEVSASEPFQAAWYIESYPNYMIFNIGILNSGALNSNVNRSWNIEIT